MVSMKVKKTKQKKTVFKWRIEKTEKDRKKTKNLFGESNIEMGLAIDTHIMKCDKIANKCSNKQISYL